MSTRAYSSIFLCEPHCRGFEHAQFNAALIASFQAAFPGTTVVFMGEGSHLQHVQSWLRGWPGNSLVEYREMAIEDPSASYLKGTLQRVTAYRVPLDLTRKEADSLVVYCSTAPKGTLLLKVLVMGRPLSVRVAAVFHNQLARLLPFSRFNEMNLILSFHQPRSLMFLVLGESLREVAAQSVSFRPGGLAAIDLPSLRAGFPLRADQAGPGLCFGFLGVSLNKGFDVFVSLARRLQGSGSSARFSMVGTVNHTTDAASFRDVVPDAGCVPISEEEYQRRAEALTYVIWTASPRDYDLRASATFVDALAFGKPGIYLRNRYVEHYFGRFGDIGYLCDDVESMFRIMREVSERFPLERYGEQQKNIAAARACFSPEGVGARLRDIFGS